MRVKGLGFITAGLGFRLRIRISVRLELGLELGLGLGLGGPHHHAVRESAHFFSRGEYGFGCFVVEKNVLFAIGIVPNRVRVRVERLDG